MPTDTCVIQRHGTTSVLAQRFEVMFRDGQAIGLHPVAREGRPELYLRAVQGPGQRWLVFDVRQLGEPMAEDLRRLQQRDHQGCIFFGLRALFPTRGAFLEALPRLALQAWPCTTTEVKAA